MDRGAWKATVPVFSESEMTGVTNTCTFIHEGYFNRKNKKTRVLKLVMNNLRILKSVKMNLT